MSCNRSFQNVIKNEKYIFVKVNKNIYCLVFIQNDKIKLRTDFFIRNSGFPTLFVEGFYDLVPAEKTCQS